MNPLFLPPRLLFRALDDLHAIALAARTLPGIEARLAERFELLDGRAAQLEALGAELVRAAGDAQAGLAAAVETGTRIEARGEQLLERADQLDGRTDEVLAVSARVEETAREVARRGAEVAAAMPILEQALLKMDEVGAAASILAQTVEPLQGAAERMGRIVDRLPGARAAGS